MNLSDGIGDASASASLTESEEMTPCTVRQKKKGVKNKKEDTSYCPLKEERCVQEKSKGK
jgi:hypothetical protein